jgi:hypothetical protein
MSVTSISSVPAPPPVNPPDAGAAKTPDPTPNSDADASRAAASQPAVLAALPPGQGTRIDQIA